MTTKKDIKQFVCLSGLPRTGSTLLSAILCQNPKIHAEGNSAVCQLMWDVQQSCLNNCGEQLSANNKKYILQNFIKEIPNIYYSDSKEEIIVDKCRSWTIPANIELLKLYLGNNFKIIILERSITEIVKSFAKLHKKNGKTADYNMLLKPGYEPIMRSINGINFIRNAYKIENNRNNNFLFINYNNLVNETERTIQQIYDFCGWEYFEHDFNNVKVKYEENDEIYGLKGHHEIRSKVEKEHNEIILPSDIQKRCEEIDRLMGYQ